MIQSKHTTYFYLDNKPQRFGYIIGTPKTDKNFVQHIRIGAYIIRKGNVLIAKQGGETTYWLINHCNGKFYEDPIRPEYYQDSMLTGTKFYWKGELETPFK